MANQRFQRDSRSQNDRIDNIHHSDRSDRSQSQQYGSYSGSDRSNNNSDNDYYRSSDYYSSSDYRPAGDYRSNERSYGSDRSSSNSNDYRSSQDRSAYNRDRDFSSRSDFTSRSDYSPYRSSSSRDDQTSGAFDYQSSRSMSYRPQDERHTGRYNSDFPRYGSSSNDLSYDSDYRDMGSSQLGDYRNYGSQSSSSSQSFTGTSHAGRGPKGWKRSDERIREDVCERLERDAHVDATEIEVQVADGVVTLSGHVETRRAKRHAEDIIENLAGVRDVNNSLSVDQSLFEQAKEFFTGESSKPVGGKAGKGPATANSTASSEKQGSRH